MPPEPAGRELLSILLDKYEGSVFFKTGTRPSRKIKLRLYDSGLSDYRRYNIENPERRQEINRAVLGLAEKGLVRFLWMKGEQNHIIAQVSLNTDTADAIAAAYAFLGRKPKDALAGEIGLEVSALLARIKSPWMRRFLEDCRDSLLQNRAPSGKLPINNDERKNLFRALSFIDEQPDNAEILERVFSIRCFGNSKIFETEVKKRLLDIIRRYSDCEDDRADEELLAFAGIVRYPEVFEFRGPLRIFFQASIRNLPQANYKAPPQEIDFSPLWYGASLSSTDFKRGVPELPQSLVRLLSIENKANYISYIHQNPGNTELVVYHGGQFSPFRGGFFRALAAALPEGCPWDHWGDIDYGGFSMLARLRREIRGDVRPYRMDEGELAAYAALTLPVTEAYADKLRTLVLREELSDCLPCINYLIRNRVRLEQEAMLHYRDRT
ncbi:MAG: DUF2220 domain-containing protein [Treponema sp.]|jgi:hypothetical protein|nr:DUF2220 domain-containing protein [Treponema sp.]